MPPPPEVSPDEAEARAEALAEQARQAQARRDQQAADDAPGGARVETAPPVQVVLVWQGIGALHKGFFSDPALVTALSADLAGLVASPANIYIRYDSRSFAGSIRLQLRPDTRLLPVGTHGDRVVALQDLAPITTALANYRSGVASRFDLRVESFSIGIESFRGPHSCLFGATGPAPPDGRVVSPCVEVDGQQRCGEPGPDGVAFDPAVAKIIRSCLDL
ncbi:MAG: hypothetical protein D6798_02790 [Deltaproteobacteria bacterium]|nr:MAG: hypothetical protein D6798_02790 [Deltaproteobacteria bacterium]